MSKSRLVIHLRVYRGKTLSFDAKGKSTNENQIVALEYQTPEYQRFLSMMLSNGFIKADVEKVLDLSKINEGKEKSDKDYYQEIKEFADIQKEIDAALNPLGVEKELTPEQKRIAELEARLDALTGVGAKNVDVKDSKNISDSGNQNKEIDVALKEAREKYQELHGKKGHHSWTVEEINLKIAEFKPE